MALLDIDKIIIKRTVIGIRCLSCGGNLVAMKKSLLCLIVFLGTLGLRKCRRYSCETCKKKYTLL